MIIDAIMETMHAMSGLVLVETHRSVPTPSWHVSFISIYVLEFMSLTGSIFPSIDSGKLSLPVPGS